MSQPHISTSDAPAPAIHSSQEQTSASPLKQVAPASQRTQTGDNYPNTTAENDNAALRPSLTREYTNTVTSAATNASARLRRASIKLLDTDPPPGFMAGLGTYGSKAPTPTDIRSRSYTLEGWQPRSSVLSQPQELESSTEPFSEKYAEHGNVVMAQTIEVTNREKTETSMGVSTPAQSPMIVEPAKSISTENRNAGAHSTSQPRTPPPPLPWTKSFVIGLRAFSKWVLTIPGFLITLYGLNVVAWGGMLFLLLCNASPAMCKPTCSDINSPRRKWIEIDSQILNALFCVTGFGLAPWRLRDLYWWAWWRLGRTQEARSIGIRRLAGIHRGWFRLPESHTLPLGVPREDLDPNHPSLPIPVNKAPTEPLTLVRAPPTASWKMDYVVWCNMWNTFFQACLCGFMWGMNRYNRPSWSTGLFVALACIVAALGGLMVFQEGKKVKKIEGADISDDEKRARGWDIESNDVGVRGEASAIGLGLAEIQQEVERETKLENNSSAPEVKHS